MLAHDLLFLGASGPVMRRAGFLPATRENADAVLSSGGVTIVFPGGDYDVFRPSSQATPIDFDGRTGYVRTALAAGVPIVPVVSIGGHEDQIHLSRGELWPGCSRLREALRTKYVPVTFGFPFGLTLAFPPNLPLPTKIRTQVLEPIDIEEEFGEDPDIAEVDAVVRERMQTALERAQAGAPLPGARMTAPSAPCVPPSSGCSGRCACSSRSGMIAPMRPDKYLRQAAVIRRQGATR